MSPLTPVHVVAGLAALAAGAIALATRKGAAPHRTSGMVFVGAMLVMALTGSFMAMLGGERITIAAGLLTTYLVVTALRTVRRPTPDRWDAAMLVLGASVGLYAISLAAIGFAHPKRTVDGLPAGVALMFATVATLGAIGDVRLLRARGVSGARRIARHLWRMCFALWIATASFFLGQPQVFPAPIRSSPLPVLPVLLVLILMFVWLARVRLMRRVPERR